MSELAIPIIFFLALIIFSSLWKLFQKAGTPGWYILIPIYGEWVLAGISGRPKWLGLPLALSFTYESGTRLDAGLLVLVAFITLIWLIPWVLIMYKLPKQFGKSSRFGLLTIVLPFIGLPVLAFGRARFRSLASISDFRNNRATIEDGSPDQ
jgi:hypothetical protein